MTVESVEAAQDAFREELEEIEVVQQTLTNTYDIALGDEEYDLIAELEALLNTHASSTESDVEYDLPDISKLNLGNPNAVTLIAEDEVIPSKSHLPIQS